MTQRVKGGLIPFSRSGRLFLILILSWTVITGVFSLAYFLHEKNEKNEVAKESARAAIQKDIVYRLWNSHYGGVYLPADQIPPNPYLAHLPERDVVTSSGQHLTLVNPAYMTRMAHELGAQEYGLKGHITSLSPLRPENAPDPWEAKALERLQKGEKEVSEKVMIGKTPYWRVMVPMVVTEPCLKCHGDAGYRLGDLRGGVSASIPLTSEAFSWAEKNLFWYIFPAIWFLGAIGIVWGVFLADQRRLAGEALRMSELKFQHILELSPVAVMATNARQQIIFLNQKFTDLFGYVQAHIPTREIWWQRVFPDPVHRKKVTAAWTKALQQAGEEKIGITLPEVPMTCKDGTVLEISPSFVALEDLTVTLFYDMTELRRNEKKLKENEEKYRRISESSSDWDFWILPDGRFSYVSRSCETVTGHKPEEFLADKELLRRVILPEDRGIFESHHKEMEAKGHQELEFRIVRKDGEVRWIWHVCRPVLDNQGDFLGLRADNRDITEQKRAEEKLMQAVVEWKKTFDGIPDALFLMDRDYGLLKVNKAACDLFNMGAEELIRKKCCELFHHRHSPRPDCPFQEVMKDRKPHTEEALGPNGEALLVTVAPILDEKGEVSGAIHIAKDITRFKASEREREWFSDVLDSSLNEIYVFDSKTLHFIKVNQGAQRNLGYTMEELKQLTPLDLKPEFTRETFMRLISPLVTGAERQIVFLTEHKRKDGSLYPVEVHLQFLKDGAQSVFVAIILDITERKKTERALQQADKRYRELVEGTGDLITVVDPQGYFTYVNHTAEKIFGIKPEDCVGRLAFDFIHPDDRERTRKAFEGWVRDKKKQVVYQNRQLNKSGQVFDMLWSINLHFNDSGEITEISNFARDITEIKKLEEEKARRLRELEIFYQASVDRELTMVEQKKRIQALQEEIERLKGKKNK